VEKMKVFELKLKLYACKDIKNENSLTCISELIDKNFLKDESLAKIHKENIYKNYVFNSLYPIESSKIYKAGNIYTVVIRTVDEGLVEHFSKVLVNEYTDYLKALALEKKIIPIKHIDRVYSVTPAVAKFDTGYWRTNETLEIFEKRLRENLIKKYNTYFNTKLSEDFELFTFIKFENQKPIATNYKNIKILGDKITLNVAENSTAQELAYFALGTGILEMNSRGLGFVNFKWL
jgi:CRISPR-associated endoribonuclease Cas6